MAALSADDLKKEGLELTQRLPAALPMPVWALDLEVERQREVSAAEIAVLRHVENGVGDAGQLAQLLGMGNDRRLAENALVRLLRRAAVDRTDTGFAITPVGQAWKLAGKSLDRERVTHEIRLDPILDRLEWVDSEEGVNGADESWTIEVAPMEDTIITERKAAVGELVRNEGLPDDSEKPPGQAPPPIDLRTVAVVSRRVHWREVAIETWTNPRTGGVQLVGYVAEAENPPLSRFLSSYVPNQGRRRFVHRET